MTRTVYALKDTLVGYKNLLVFGSDPEAVRAFAALSRDPASEVHVYNENYELYAVASWDSESGKMEGFEPRFIARAAAYAVKE